MKYYVKVNDKETEKSYEVVVNVRSDASIKRVVLKAIEQIVSDLSSDELEFMREVNYLYREAYDEEDFIEQLKQELDLHVVWEEAEKNHEWKN